MVATARKPVYNPKEYVPQSKRNPDGTYKLESDDVVNEFYHIMRVERDYWTRLHLFDLRTNQPGTFVDMTFRLGSRSFRNWQPKDLDKIAPKDVMKAYQVIDNAASESNVAEASIRAYKMLKLHTDTFVDTGYYQKSIAIFIRTVGGQDIEIQPSELRAENIPERSVVSFLYLAPYAGHLETIQRNGKVQGTLFFMSKVIRKLYGRQLHTKFDWLSPGRAPTQHIYPVPRLQIGAPGDLKGASKTPKRKKWTGSRRSQRGRIRDATSGRFAAGPNHRRFSKIKKRSS
jgi:hypothetical protein